MIGQHDVDIARYVVESRKVLDEHVRALNHLKAENDRLVRLNGREKTASTQEVFDGKGLALTLGRLAEAGYVDESELEKVAADVQRDPDLLLAFVGKIASAQASGGALDMDWGEPEQAAAAARKAPETESDAFWRRCFSK